MKKWKKFLATFLAVCLLTGSMSPAVQASGVDETMETVQAPETEQETESVGNDDSEETAEPKEEVTETQSETEKVAAESERESVPESAEETEAEAEVMDAADENPTPYYYLHAWEAKYDDEKSIGGVTYSDAIVFHMCYNGRDDGGTCEIDYNLHGGYTSLSFTAGFVKGYKENAALTVTVDGSDVVSDTLTATGGNKTYSIDLTGANYLRIRFTGSHVNWKYYGIGGINFVRNSNIIDDTPITTNMYWNCWPNRDDHTNEIVNAQLLQNKTFTMGGNSYQDGIEMNMQYNGRSDDYTATAIFDFNGYYNTISFDVGNMINGDNRNCTMVCYCDGVETADDNGVISHDLSYDDISRTYTYTVTGVKEFKIYMQASSGGTISDSVHFGIGGVQLVSDGNVHGIRFKEDSFTLTATEPAKIVEAVPWPLDAEETQKAYVLSTDDGTIVHVNNATRKVAERNRGTTTIRATLTAVDDDQMETSKEAACTVTSEVHAYLPSVDGWGFNNENYKYAELEENLEYLENRLMSLKNKPTLSSALAHIENPLQYVVANIAERTLQSYCFGMAVTSALIYTGDVKWSDINWNSETLTYSYPGDVPGLNLGTNNTYGTFSDINLSMERFILAGQLFYYTKDTAFGKKSDYDGLYSAIVKFQNNSTDPVILHISAKKSDGTNFYHAVVAYKIIKNSDNTTDIYVYDPNQLTGTDPDERKITIDTTSGKNITGVQMNTLYPDESFEDGATLTYQNNITDFAALLKNSAELELPERIITTTAKNLIEVSLNANKAAEFKDGIFSIIDASAKTAFYEYHQVNGESNGSAFNDNAFVQNTDKPVTLKLNDTEDVESLIINNDSAIYLKTDGQATITTVNTDTEQSVTVIPGSGNTFEIRYNFADGHSIIVDGTTDSQVEAYVQKGDEAVNDKLIIRGVTSASVTVMDSDSEQTYTAENLDASKEYTADKTIAKSSSKDVSDVFKDVSSTSWYHDSVQYVYDNGLMTGLDSTTFGPSKTLSRAQFAVILWRMSGSPAQTYTSKFPDVREGTWYTDAVLWANSVGVVTGYQNGKFGPSDMITREQMALMMYRYAGVCGYDRSTKASFTDFTDANRVSSFAKEAMQWAVGMKIITGMQNGTALVPQGQASRAECATIIMRFMKAYK